MCVIADFITLGCLATSFISSLASEMQTGTTCELSRAVYLGAIGSMTYRGRARERGENNSLDNSPHKTTKASLLSHCSVWIDRWNGWVRTGKEEWNDEQRKPNTAPNRPLQPQRCRTDAHNCLEPLLRKVYNNKSLSIYFLWVGHEGLITINRVSERNQKQMVCYLSVGSAKANLSFIEQHELF